MYITCFFFRVNKRCDTSRVIRGYQVDLAGCCFHVEMDVRSHRFFFFFLPDDFEDVGISSK